ncbi:hypothetical protein [Thermus tenuipuniceus]|uniref:hypothetical protein n=1 Tax=Thermus tenuipuniceus TaxID=2078690 RepID=UPI000CFA52E1|nr:hypothetical protein [Thermus tenuipuniceus]
MGRWVGLLGLLAALALNGCFPLSLGGWRLEGELGEALWLELALPRGLEAVSPRAQGAPTPGMALGRGVAYLTDPVRSQVVRVELEGWKGAVRLEVGGVPSAFLLFEVEGVEH